MFKELFLDVSELAAPEPFTQITQLMCQLDSSNYIRVKHRMQPFPLYDLLNESGYSYAVLEITKSNYNIFIWLSEYKVIADYCQNLSQQ